MGKKKKTMEDVLKLKETPCDVFGTDFNYIVESLFDWYIAKIDGSERIENFLKDWSKECQIFWLMMLDERIALAQEEIEEIKMGNWVGIDEDD